MGRKNYCWLLSLVITATCSLQVNSLGKNQCALSCGAGKDCMVVEYRSPNDCRPLGQLRTCDRPGTSRYFVSVSQTCAKTCLELLRQQPKSRDGVYQLQGIVHPVYCDMTHNGGGWTLLLTAVSQTGWSLENVQLRNAATPSLQDNYSILEVGERLKSLGKGNKFLYRIEAQAQRARGLWGGVWSAPRSYSLISEQSNQTDVSLRKRFGSWKYSREGIQARVPWINAGDYARGTPLLTTTDRWRSEPYWGTLVTRPNQTAYRHSPWIYGTAAEDSGTVLYWLREEARRLPDQ